MPIDPLWQLAEHTNLHQYSKGELVFLEGDPCTGLHILESGLIKLYRISLNGREIIINILSKGSTFNEVPVFDGGLNPVNVEALEESSIWVVDAAVIREKMVEYPEFSRAVIINLTKNLRMLVNMVDQLCLCNVSERLARMLIQHSKEGVIEYVTQDQLAARLGTVREVIARCLRDFEKSGAIHVSKGKIEIIDPSLLESLMQLQRNINSNL
ncbi:MAG: Crp/Fnr family transcriptional regulator [Anaerolineales bacterium]